MSRDISAERWWCVPGQVQVPPGLARAGAVPGGTFDKVGVETVLKGQQDLARLGACAQADDVAEIVESLDARG